MAKNSVADWSTTAANNTDVGGININEGNAPSTMNNAVREMMAQIKAGVPILGSANTFTATQTITSTDAGAGVGPILTLYRNSASPAASDTLGQLLFNGEDSAGNTQEYASIVATISDATTTSEDGTLDFYATVAGVPTLITSLGPNLSLGSVGQIRFPATANPSSDVNTLDDYEEGTFTPAITFATPGNLSVTYTLQAGFYTKIGRQVTASFHLLTSSFTHTTASGGLRVTSLPFTSLSTTNNSAFGSLFFDGITKATFTQFIPRVTEGVTYVDFLASGSGVSPSAVSAADMPTGGSVLLRGTITYFTA